MKLMEDEKTSENTAIMMMNSSAANGGVHTRNIAEISRDKTILVEESKNDGGNVSSADFMSGLGISVKSNTMYSARPMSVYVNF